MKKMIAALFASTIMATANAGGLVQVLDNEADDALMYIDLDSVTGTKNQVLGGAIGELYVSAIIRIDILEGSPLKTAEDVNYIAQNWVISCNDNSYYKLASSSYGSNGNLISSFRMGDDIPLKSQFTLSSQTNDTERAVTMAINLACNKYLEDNPAPHFIKFQG